MWNLRVWASDRTLKGVLWMRSWQWREDLRCGDDGWRFNLKEKWIGFCALEILRTVFAQYVSMRSAKRRLSLRQYMFGCNLGYHFPFTTQLYSSLHINPYYCTKILLISEAKSWQLQKKREVQNYQFMVVHGATGCLWHAYTATHLTNHSLYKGYWSHHQSCKLLVHNHDFSLARLWFLNSSPVYLTAATVFSTPLKLDGAGMLCTQDSKPFNPWK
jgi:hypothetical protein